MDQYSIELALAATISVSELLVMDIQASCAQSHYLLVWVMDE